MKNNWAWSEKGTRAVVKIPQSRAPSHTMIGAICSTSVLHVVMRKPVPPPPKKPAKKERPTKARKELLIVMKQMGVILYL